MRRLHEDERHYVVDRNQCPWCMKKETFVEGPSGGASQNFICNNPMCGVTINVTPMGIDLVRESRLGTHEPLRYTPTPAPNAPKPPPEPPKWTAEKILKSFAPKKKRRFPWLRA
jgi:hypothetical protein